MGSRLRGWVVVDGLFLEEVLRGLRGRLDELEAGGALTPARVGRGEERQRLSGVRGDLISWLYGPLELGGPREGLTAAEGAFYDRVDELILGLNRGLFLGVRGREFHYACYGAGAGYQRHLDRFRGQSGEGQRGEGRKVSLVTYLNDPDWREGDGGELRLWVPLEGGGEREVMVAPSWGRTVCFESDRFPHEVLPARRARRSVTGWLFG